MLTHSILQITKSYHGHDGITQLNPLCALKLKFEFGRKYLLFNKFSKHSANPSEDQLTFRKLFTLSGGISMDQLST